MRVAVRRARDLFKAGGVAARIAEACDHLWGDRGAAPFNIAPLRAAVAPRSPGGELAAPGQHDTDVAFTTMLNELLRELDDVGEGHVRALCAMLPVTTRRCAGPRCRGTGAPVVTAEDPTMVLPPVKVPHGADLYGGADGFKLFLAERSAAPQTAGQHPNTRCSGTECKECDPVPTACTCGRPLTCLCPDPGHRYQPFAAQQQMRDPPQVLFVPVSRSGFSRLGGRGRKSNAPVQLPTAAFDASALFVHPNSNGGAHYRVFAAVYHAGATLDRGHYCVPGRSRKAPQICTRRSGAPGSKARPFLPGTRFPAPPPPPPPPPCSFPTPSL